MASCLAQILVAVMEFPGIKSDDIKSADIKSDDIKSADIKRACTIYIHSVFESRLSTLEYEGIGELLDTRVLESFWIRGY